MSGARELLELQATTGAVCAPSGRAIRVNAPGGGRPALLYMAGCDTGWIVRLRDDVEDAAAHEIEALVKQEPPVTAPGAVPRHAERYRELLGICEPLTDHNYGPIHRLPHGTVWPGATEIVCQHTLQGDALWARLQRDGVPRHMVEDGFADLTHFWEPWCVALEGSEIAAIAFAARLGPKAADLGLHTMRGFRGRGFGAAATAAWSTMPALKDRVLFYSTHRDNLSSRRVIARLDLPFLGESLRL